MKMTIKSIAIWSSIAAIAAVATTVFATQIIAVASPSFVEGKLSAYRVAETSEFIQNPTKAAQFVPVPAVVVEKNPKLKAVITDADSRYDVLANLSPYSSAMPVNPVADVSITEDEANSLLSSLVPSEVDQKVFDNHVVKYHYMKMQVNGKYYFVTISAVGRQ